MHSNLMQFLNILHEAWSLQHDEHLSLLIDGDKTANQLSLSYL